MIIISRSAVVIIFFILSLHQAFSLLYSFCIKQAFYFSRILFFPHVFSHEWFGDHFFFPVEEKRFPMAKMTLNLEGTFSLKNFKWGIWHHYMKKSPYRENSDNSEADYSNSSGDNSTPGGGEKRPWK